MTYRQYLSLPERVSQVYLNKYTIILLLLILKIYLFKKSLLSSLSSVSGYLDCSPDVQDFPKILSSLISKSVQKSLGDLQYNYLVLIKMTISIIKNLLIFYVDIFLGTYVCLLGAAVTGTVDFALDSTETLIKGVNSTVVAIAHDLEDGLDGLTSVLNDIITAANGVLNFFKGKTSPSESTIYIKLINLSISALQNISIPLTVITKIDKFRQNDLLNFDRINNETLDLISFPFDLVSKELLSSLFNTSVARNVSLLNNLTFPVMEQVNPLCETSLEFEKTYQSLAQLVEKASRCILITLIVAAVVGLIPLIIDQYFKRYREKRFVTQLTPETPISTLNVINRFDNKLIYYLHKFRVSRNPQLYWLINYVTSQYALVVLFIGLAGLFAVLLQYSMLKLVRSEVQKLVAYANSGNETKQAISKSTESYLNQTSQYLTAQEAALNEELFGHVKSLSTSLNATLDSFMKSVNKTVNSVFSGTPLEGPVNTIVYCTLGRKVAKLETGLTWINKHLEINIPGLGDDFKNDVLKLALSQSNSKVGVALSSGFQKTLDLFSAGIWLEFIVSMAIFGLWVVQLLVGIVIVVARNRICITDDASRFGSVEKICITRNTIRGPYELTSEQRLNYGYPYANPQEIRTDLTSIHSLSLSPSHDTDTTRTGMYIGKPMTSSSYYSSEIPERTSSKTTI